MCHVICAIVRGRQSSKFRMRTWHGSPSRFLLQGGVHDASTDGFWPALDPQPTFSMGIQEYLIPVNFVPFFLAAQGGRFSNFLSPKQGVAPEKLPKTADYITHSGESRNGSSITLLRSWGCRRTSFRLVAEKSTREQTQEHSSATRSSNRIVIVSSPGSAYTPALVE